MEGHQSSIQDHVSVVQIAAQKLASAKLVRPASSKYDFIKARVHQHSHNCLSHTHNRSRCGSTTASATMSSRAS